MKKKKIIILICIIILTILCVGYYVYRNNKNIVKDILEPVKINYEDYYYEIAITKEDKKLYKLVDDKLTEIGLVAKDVLLYLDKDEFIKDGYFKIKDMDYYIDYKNIEESTEETKEDIHWKNFIPFNESIKTNEKTKLNQNDKLIYTINESLSLPIIIKKENAYGIIYKDKLYYISKNDGEVIENQNTELGHTNGFSALVYHATYDHTNQEEKRKCINANSTICLSDTQFDEQMKYLKDNGYYTAWMNDVEMFVDGKIQLPEKTVVITIDDGYFADAAVKVLEKYDLHATLFLIGALSEVDEWKTDAWYSKSLELHSHTYHMHDPGKCPGGQGSAIKCLDKETLLADLKKSREQLNGSTVFCYPFFEYNDYAISVLKEAGFTMAFAGGRQKIKVGSDKMKLSRYGIINTSTLNDFIKTIN